MSHIIPDTNILLRNPNVIIELTSKNHFVIIPMTVIDELDRLKMKKPHRQARQGQTRGRQGADKGTADSRQTDNQTRGQGLVCYGMMSSIKMTFYRMKTENF